MSEALALQGPAVALMRDVAKQLAALPPERYGEAMEFLSTMEKAVEGLRTTFGARVKDKVLEDGTKTTEKGTREWVMNGYLVRAIPTRTGVDAKKLEPKLRAKGLDPTVAMDATMAYKVSETKLAVAVSKGLITQEEVDSCKHDINYRLEVTRCSNE